MSKGMYGAHDRGRLPQELAKLRRYKLLIVDEVGPARAALIPIPTARWVVPVQGGPSRATFLASSRKTPVPRYATRFRSAAVWWSKLNSSSRSFPGNLAALIRRAAPEASRSATSRERTAARYSSCDQPASRARAFPGGPVAVGDPRGGQCAAVVLDVLHCPVHRPAPESSRASSGMATPNSSS